MLEVTELPIWTTYESHVTDSLVRASNLPLSLENLYYLNFEKLVLSEDRKTVGAQFFVPVSFSRPFETYFANKGCPMEPSFRVIKLFETTEPLPARDEEKLLNVVWDSFRIPFCPYQTEMTAYGMRLVWRAIGPRNALMPVDFLDSAQSLLNAEASKGPVDEFISMMEGKLKMRLDNAPFPIRNLDNLMAERAEDIDDDLGAMDGSSSSSQEFASRGSAEERAEALNTVAKFLNSSPK